MRRAAIRVPWHSQEPRSPAAGTAPGPSWDRSCAVATPRSQAHHGGGGGQSTLHPLAKIIARSSRVLARASRSPQFVAGLALDNRARCDSVGRSGDTPATGAFSHRAASSSRTWHPGGLDDAATLRRKICRGLDEIDEAVCLDTAKTLIMQYRIVMTHVTTPFRIRGNSDRCA